MSTPEAQNKTTHEGSYATQQTHTLEKGILEAAIAQFEAVAAKFAADAIKDSKTRERYMAHIKEVSDETRRQVDGGHITVKDGAVYINQLRDKLFVEYRNIRLPSASLARKRSSSSPEASTTTLTSILSEHSASRFQS
ncbi:hypothetical protein [Burkholderia diffusa]|uniref:hypothetical protein n=1 Tax=Burkholderia diffusa TaxID=488732 RepID=UPI001E5A6768|nr:hypothetical protein [Burkholderia diffusa]